MKSLILVVSLILNGVSSPVARADGLDYAGACPVDLIFEWVYFLPAQSRLFILNSSQKGKFVAFVTTCTTVLSTFNPKIL